MIPNLMTTNLSRTTQQPSNPKILTDLIISMSQTKSKQQILNQLSKVDEQLFQIYEGTVASPRKSAASQFNKPAFYNEIKSIDEFSPNSTGYLASTFNNTTSVALGVPKNNSLTDSFLRTTLGCEEKLAKSYLQILDQSDLTEQIEKEKRIEQAKKRFAQSNNYKDIYANCKPYMDKTIARSYLKKSQPVIDNEHDAYLKTQLIYLQKPLLGGKKVSEKEYYDKHADVVAKKINQIGGMEDTVGNMEQSLAKNQIKNFTRRSHFYGNTASSPFKNNKSLVKKTNTKESGNSWVDRSKSIRQALMTKFDIQ